MSISIADLFTLAIISVNKGRFAHSQALCGITSPTPFARLAAFFIRLFSCRYSSPFRVIDGSYHLMPCIPQQLTKMPPSRYPSFRSILRMAFKRFSLIPRFSGVMTFSTSNSSRSIAFSNAFKIWYMTLKAFNSAS